MVNINLSTNKVAPINRKEVMAKNGLTSVIVIFVLVVCLYGGLLFWKSDLDKKIAIADAAYDAKYSELTSGRNIEVTDLQNRIFLAKELVKKDRVKLNALENVEKNIVVGVYLDAYVSSEGSNILELECIADNYDAIARQILSFKHSEAFSDVTIGSAKIGENGKINFSISIRSK
ncbi:MAG: hypothetical protein Q7T51_02050 [Candidatus Moranbacteria bacterium]|nr:hypothetical protein [Candidatus Moranbacteria bacterium]